MRLSHVKFLARNQLFQNDLNLLFRPLFRAAIIHNLLFRSRKSEHSAAPKNECYADGRVLQTTLRKLLLIILYDRCI